MNRARARLWTATVAAVVGGFIGAPVALAAISSAAGSRVAETGFSLTASIVTASMSAVLVVVCGWAGLHAEHRLRHQYKVAAQTEGHQHPLLHKPHGPVTTSLFLAIYLAVIVVMLPGAVPATTMHPCPMTPRGGAWPVLGRSLGWTGSTICAQLELRTQGAVSFIRRRSSCWMPRLSRC
jgi:hypothetical protein